MKRAIVLIGLMFGGIMMPAPMAMAAGRVMAPSPASVRMLPFPRSEQAESVWASGACWNTCQSACTWYLPACLQVDGQGRCLQHTDACDRACQRSCRTRGGPYLPID